MKLNHTAYVYDAQCIINPTEHTQNIFSLKNKIATENMKNILFKISTEKSE
jgi:hypothetical protein